MPASENVGATYQVARFRNHSWRVNYLCLGVTYRRSLTRVLYPLYSCTTSNLRRELTMTDGDTANNGNDPFKAVTEPFCCAEKFVDRLIELQDEWQDDGGWIFRGQNSATWNVEPSLFRQWKPEYGHTYEFRLIDNFIQNANLINLNLPSNTMSYVAHLRNHVSATSAKLADDNGNGLAYDTSHAVFAIAQHYGIPTRLLDFTYNALVAAFFACDTTSLLESHDLSADYLEGCFEEIVAIYQDSPSDAIDALRCHVKKYIRDLESLPKKMAVWALKFNALEPFTELRILNHLQTEIPNLRAQEGVFVIHKEIRRKDSCPSNPWPSFEKELLKLISSGNVKKLTLPHDEGDNLWRILESKKMGHMHIYPSYDNVAKSVLEGEHKWRGKSAASIVS